MIRPLTTASALLRSAGAGNRRAPWVVVTGGAGFIGSHLVGELLARGHRVRVIDDLSTGSLANLDGYRGASLDVVLASVALPEVASAACADASMVFHLAGVVGVRRLAREPLTVMQKNLDGTTVLLEAAARGRVGVLFASSSEVYGDGPVPFCEDAPVRPGATVGLRGGYACAKAMGEWLAFGHAAQSGLPVVIARLFNTVGPRQTGDHGMVLPRFVGQAVRGEAITVYGDGSQTRCFAHVGEVARALADLAQAPGVVGGVFNVGSEAETTVADLAAIVRAAADSGSPIEHVPFTAVFPHGFGDPVRRVPQLERLRTAIGWVPSRPLRAIVDELVALARSGSLLPVSCR